MRLNAQNPPTEQSSQILETNKPRLNEQYVNTSQDDYFLIGPTDRESGLSIAYPNRLKRCIAESKIGVDKPLHNSLEKKDVKKTAVLARGRRNEGVQTNCPRATLQQEIKLIRDEIDRQKMRQRHFSTQSRANNENEGLQKNISASNKHKNNSQQLSQQLKLPLREISNQDNDEVLKAPRTVKKELKKDLNEYAMQRPRDLMRSKERSGSSYKPYRLTEYQRAFRTPAMAYRPQSRKISKDPRTVPLKRSNVLHIPKTNYTTEYSQQYKPFKYVTEGELTSNTLINTERKYHIVPVPRPRSAYYEPEPKVLPTTKQHQRSKTPPIDHLKTRPHSTEFITEYNAKYHSHDPQSFWSDAVSQPRNCANEYRQRHQSSHFIADHLAQLDSNCVDLWDTPSTDRYAERYGKQEYLNPLPAAGIPTRPGLSLHSDENIGDSSLLKMRRWDMLSGQEVANILNPADDIWSGESIVSEGYTNPKCYDFACMVRPHTADAGSVDSVRKLHTCNECCTSRQSCGNETVTLRSKMEHVPTSIGVSGDPSISSFSNPRCVSTGRCCRQKRSDESANERGASTSPSPISPLSNRSIRSSASIASETLERARRQRNRMLPHYNTERYQSNRCHQLGTNNRNDQFLQTVY